MTLTASLASNDKKQHALYILSDFPGIRNISSLSDLNDLNRHGNITGLNDLNSLFGLKKSKAAYSLTSG